MELAWIAVLSGGLKYMTVHVTCISLKFVVAVVGVAGVPSVVVASALASAAAATVGGW